MPEQEQFKRHVAYKLRIGDILRGNPILNGERFSLLELGDKKIVRVNVVGNVVEKFASEGDKKYSFVTLDDASGQIRIKTFGDEITKLKDVIQGNTVLIMGVLRFFNDEIYISPEIIKFLDPAYLLVRKLEIERGKDEKKPKEFEKNKIVAVKDSVLELIKKFDNEGGIDKEKIIMELKQHPIELINQEIQKLLEEGMVYEPRPGVLRWLG